MQLLWGDSVESFDSQAAQVVLNRARCTPSAAIALPTGRTPLGLYARLRARALAEPALFGDLRWFDLDEYLGLGEAHPLSYANFLRTHLLDGIGAPVSRVRLLHGDAADPQTECRDYDRAIAAAGGLDLAILGLGANGHIAFNEPGAAWDLTTHVAELSEQTRAANALGLGGTQEIPHHGLTMGIATLRQAREVLLLVAGGAKRGAFQALIRGVADRGWPVTSFIGHPALTVIASGDLRSAHP